MQYNIKNDGKLHSRYTDLVRATPRQVENIIKEQTGEKKRFKNDVLTFGETRHNMFEKETKQTGMLPVVFREEFPEYKDLVITHAEEEFATELFKNIVIHSRPDAVAANDAIIIDYKTQVKGAGGARKYSSSKQLIFYAYQLAVHNIRIKKYVYMVEIWSETYDEIIGYDKFEKDIKLLDIAAIKKWAHGRCEVLAIGMKMAGLWKSDKIKV